QLPKRRTLMITQTVAMTLAFILFGLSATGVIQVWHILVIAVILGCANSVDMPSRQSFAVEMVGRDDIANAVGLNSALFNTSRILLMAITVLGLVATFGMNFSVLVPPLADKVLGVGATGYGFLMAASGVGSTVSALSVAFSSRVRPRRILIGACALGLGSILLSTSGALPLSLV